MSDNEASQQYIGLRRSDGVHSTPTHPQSGARCRQWCFTSYNVDGFREPDGWLFLVYQTERCPTSRRRHIQGVVKFATQMRFQSAKAAFHDDAIHLEPCRGTLAQNVAYCTKPETRDPTGPAASKGSTGADHQGDRVDLAGAAILIVAHKTWEDVCQDESLYPAMAKYPKWCETLFRTKKQNVIVPEIELRTWQQDICDLLDAAPVKRRVIWIWSEASGTGKTTFFDFCSTRFRVLPAADFTNTLYAYDGHQVIWYDRSRAQSQTRFNDLDIFYSDIERFSNCTYHLSTKYVATTKYVNAHVVVTANSPPGDDRLGGRLAGRFHVVEATL